MLKWEKVSTFEEVSTFEDAHRSPLSIEGAQIPTVSTLVSTFGKRAANSSSAPRWPEHEKLSVRRPIGSTRFMLRPTQGGNYRSNVPVYGGLPAAFSTRVQYPRYSGSIASALAQHSLPHSPGLCMPLLGAGRTSARAHTRMGSPAQLEDDRRSSRTTGDDPRLMPWSGPKQGRRGAGYPRHRAPSANRDLPASYSGGALGLLPLLATFSDGAR